MTQRTAPPFRADHVGSLLRPAELHEARAKTKRGEMSAEALHALQDKHIREAVAKQESVGMQLVTDGEFRRDWWHIDFIHGFDGVELAEGDAYGDAKFKNTEEQPPFMTVKSKIRRRNPSMLEHFKFLKSVAKRTPKFTMPSPAMLHARGARASLRKIYPDLDERVFTGLDVDAFFLEYDTERAGGFEPLRYVPKGKTVVLGLVSSKVPELEKKDDLKRRIDAAAKYVPLENLCLSPQCGFSSTHHGNKLSADDQWRKLGLVLEVSKSVWG